MAHPSSEGPREVRNHVSALRADTGQVQVQRRGQSKRLRGEKLMRGEEYAAHPQKSGLERKSKARTCNHKK